MDCVENLPTSGERRIEVRLRHADAGALRHRGELGAANVRPPLSMSAGTLTATGAVVPGMSPGAPSWIAPAVSPSSVPSAFRA
jgi:hypothetical protein